MRVSWQTRINPDHDNQVSLGCTIHSGILLICGTAQPDENRDEHNIKDTEVCLKFDSYKGPQKAALACGNQNITIILKTFKVIDHNCDH